MSSINFRRGFFRLWIALAALWVLPALYLNSERIGLTEAKWKSAPMVDPPVAGPWEKYAPRDAPSGMFDDLIPKQGQTAIRRFSAFGPDGRKHTVEAPDAQTAGALLDALAFGSGGESAIPSRQSNLESISDEELLARHHAARNVERTDALLVTFVPPLALLLLGMGVGWIARGFWPNRQLGA